MWHRTLRITFFSLLLSHCIFANCPPHQNLNHFSDTAEVDDMLAMADKYKLCPESQDSLGYLLHKIGVTYHYYEADLVQAIFYTDLAVKQRLKYLPKNHPDIAYSYFNLAAFNEILGNIDLAIRHYKQAANILKRTNIKETRFHLKLANTYVYLGKLFDKIGDFDAALEYSKIAQKTAIILGMPLEEIRALTLQSIVYKNKKEIPKSLAATEEIDRIMGVLPKDLVVEDFVVANLINSGRVYSELADFEKALLKFKQAEKLFSKETELRIVCNCYNNMGHAHSKLNQNDKARFYYEKIINENFPSCKSFAYNNLADLYFSEKNYQKAITNYENAVLEIADLKSPLNLEELEDKLPKIEDKQGLLIYLKDLAKHLVKTAEFKTEKAYEAQALKLYFLIDETIDLMRQKHFDQNSKLFWRKEVHPIYEDAIELCFRLKEEETALYFAEKSKAILLYEKVSENVFKTEFADSLRLELNTYDNKIGYFENKKKLTASQRIELLQLKEKRNEYSLELETRYPEYARLKNETLTFKEEAVQDILPNAAYQLVEFFYGKNNVYVFTVNEQGIRIVKMRLDSGLVSDLTQFSGYFQGRGEVLTKDFEAYRDLSYSLYRKLFGEEARKNSKWIIIPDGFLYNIPFDALTTSKYTGNQFDQLPYLGKEKSLSYAYSISILKLQQSKKLSASSKMLGVFPQFKQGQRGLSPLTYSEKELNGIDDYVTLKQLKSTTATRKTFLDLASEYQILHISSHATAGSDQKPPSIELVDSTLFLSDLYKMKLNADLVVLSSCETGMGKYEAGEGVMSLARGFTYAGGNNLVSTLWQVNDASTAQIMVAYYKHLSEGMGKAAALHQAKLDYFADETVFSRYKSPYYWAGFVYVGTDSPIEFQGWAEWQQYLLSLAIVLFLFLVIQYFKRRKIKD